MERIHLKRLRKCYDKILPELNEVLKTVITSLSITAIITIVTIATAGAFAPAIAVALVGSNFAGLSGAALTSACLAYLGGGAVGAVGLLGKQNTILQSAKLLVSVREIFLNDEHDTVYSNSVYEKYVQNIMDIEKGIVELRLQADVANGKEKKELKGKIKKAEESVEAMKIARKNLRKFMSSFEEGLAQS